jgi:hypothetical protein
MFDSHQNNDMKINHSVRRYTGGARAQQNLISYALEGAARTTRVLPFWARHVSEDGT